jgi:hypothetical protein
VGILVGLLPSSRGFLVFFCVLRRGRKEKVCVAVAARDKQTDAGADDVTATTWRSMIGNWHGTC